ncbi:MAG: DNA polymerase III subunit delta [Bacteroidales bacterium]|nr:DNA polymerase III subunit delta [Candidatus Colimorpha onthohippi]
MANITSQQAISEIKSNGWLPVYLLTGEENYFIDEICDFFESDVIPEAFRDFDMQVVYGRDVSMYDVVNLVSQFPMMAPLKLVIVKEAQEIDTKNSAWDVLTQYLEHPSVQGILVLCYRNKTLPKNTKAYKVIASKGKVYERKKLYESEAVRWVGTYAKDHGYSITEKCATLIVQTVGTDLTMLANEFSKVFTVLPAGSVIGDAVVEQYMGISKEYNVFELQSAIGNRDVVKCNKIVNYFASNPKAEPLQKVLPLLYRYVVNIMVYLQDPSQLRCSPYALPEYERVSKNFTLNKLAKCINYLAEADLRCKGVGNAGTVSDSELLKELVFKMIH